MKSLNEITKELNEKLEVGEYEGIIIALGKLGIKNTSIETKIASMPKDRMLVVYTGDSKEPTQDYVYVNNTEFGTDIRQVVDFDTEYVETDNSKLNPKQIASIVKKLVSGLKE